MGHRDRAKDFSGCYDMRLMIAGESWASFRRVVVMDPTQRISWYMSGESPAALNDPNRTKYGAVVLELGYLDGDRLWHWRRQVIAGRPLHRGAEIVQQNPQGARVFGF